MDSRQEFASGSSSIEHPLQMKNGQGWNHRCLALRQGSVVVPSTCPRPTPVPSTAVNQPPEVEKCR